MPSDLDLVTLLNMRLEKEKQSKIILSQSMSYSSIGVHA